MKSKLPKNDLYQVCILKSINSLIYLSGLKIKTTLKPHSEKLMNFLTYFQHKSLNYSSSSLECVLE